MSQQPPPSYAESTIKAMDLPPLSPPLKAIDQLSQQDEIAANAEWPQALHRIIEAIGHPKHTITWAFVNPTSKTVTIEVKTCHDEYEWLPEAREILETFWGLMETPSFSEADFSIDLPFDVVEANDPAAAFLAFSAHKQLSLSEQLLKELIGNVTHIHQRIAKANARLEASS